MFIYCTVGSPLLTKCILWCVEACTFVECCSEHINYNQCRYVSMKFVFSQTVELKCAVYYISYVICSCEGSHVIRDMKKDN